jgi:hypothetical protein
MREMAIHELTRPDDGLTFDAVLLLAVKKNGGGHE